MVIVVFIVDLENGTSGTVAQSCAMFLVRTWKFAKNAKSEIAGATFMPYSDPEQARNYQREYRRLRRSGDDCTTPGTAPVPLEFAYKLRPT